MSLKEQRVLMIDTQTTGMRPPHGQLLELAWTIAAASDVEPVITSRLLALPDGQSVPPRISELTGIADDDMKQAQGFAQVLFDLQSSIADRTECAVIHYAQFEKPFLLDLYSRQGIESLPFEILCTHALTKILLPDLPSQNIRGVAGYFGSTIGPLKRSASHVRATFEIWRGLVEELERKGLHHWGEVQGMLRAKPKVVKSKYQYRLPSDRRLALPDEPGIYRMLAKNGEVLYVGKATSLKSRVNSYFRGRAGRDKRKLELMAQVWDLRITECSSPLEAALLETDEIKKFNPPYNVALKKGKRSLRFYSKDFASKSSQQDHVHSIGPFRQLNFVDHLLLLERSMKQDEFEQVFFDYVPPDQLRSAYQQFCVQIQLCTEATKDIRRLLARGVRMARQQAMNEIVEEPDTESSDGSQEVPVDQLGRRIYSDEELVEKFGRLFCRAGHEFIRRRRLNRILNCQITYQTAKGPRSLKFANGQLRNAEFSGEPPKKWHELGVETYDRMSVLLSELAKYEHHIQWSMSPQNLGNFPHSGQSSP